jgi:Arc/MetJ-type ribon-helix-helix transcriptional regulator
MLPYIIKYDYLKEKIEHNKTIGTNLAKAEYEEIFELVNVGIFLSGSDFVREAIRNKLKAMKL